jgi:hypothetical protein
MMNEELELNQLKEGDKFYLASRIKRSPEYVNFFTPLEFLERVSQVEIKCFDSDGGGFKYLGKYTKVFKSK